MLCPWRTPAVGWHPVRLDFLYLIKEMACVPDPFLMGPVALGFLAACGPGADSDADVPAGAAAESGMSAAEAADDISCWLRGETTMEEAMERPSPLGETEIDLEGHAGEDLLRAPLGERPGS